MYRINTYGIISVEAVLEEISAVPAPSPRETMRRNIGACLADHELEEKNSLWGWKTCKLVVYVFVFPLTS